MTAESNRRIDELLLSEEFKAAVLAAAEESNNVDNRLTEEESIEKDNFAAWEENLLDDAERDSRWEVNLRVQESRDFLLRKQGHRRRRTFDEFDKEYLIAPAWTFACSLTDDEEEKHEISEILVHELDAEMKLVVV